MATCVTCGAELHPERALKYNYCMAPGCQDKNAKGLTMAVVGMGKAAEELVILDERTRADLASGKYHDQRRGSFGTVDEAPTVRAGQAVVPAQRQTRPARQTRPPRRSPALSPARGPWTRRQEKLALLYNEQGIKPAEIAERLGVSSYLVTQIILAAKNRGKI
jgi:hypothetical protein